MDALNTLETLCILTGAREVSFHRGRDRGQFEAVGHVRRPSQGPEVRLREVS